MPSNLLTIGKPSFQHQNHEELDSLYLFLIVYSFDLKPFPIGNNCTLHLFVKID